MNRTLRNGCLTYSLRLFTLVEIIVRPRRGTLIYQCPPCEDRIIDAADLKGIAITICLKPTLDFLIFWNGSAKVLIECRAVVMLAQVDQFVENQVTDNIGRQKNYAPMKI